MPTVGIIGGIGPESTIAYYRSIISSYLERDKSGDYPRIIINSINMKKMLDLISANRLDGVTEYLLAELKKLESAGAEFAALASNTPHVVFDPIRQASALSLISIVEAACEEARTLGLNRLGLFGTKFTMQGDFYRKTFSDHGIAVISPDARDQDYIHEKYMDELVRGIIREDTKEALIQIMNRLIESMHIQGLILGGTELPLILKETDAGKIPFLDTTQIHVESIVRRLI